MMKRKVSVIWVVVLALIAIAACAFAAVTYYRCGKQPEPQFPENELLRVLDTGSDAEGVGFEVMRIGGGSVNLRLDLRWKNDSGRTIAYGLAFEPGQVTYSPELGRVSGLLIGIPAALLWFLVFWLAGRTWFRKQVAE